MDTKWKNRKKTISFLVFVLGVSLTLGGLADVLRKKSGIGTWQADRLLEDDYQQSARFRDYVAGRLADFLIMAPGGEGLWGIWWYMDGTYYSDRYGGYDYPTLAEDVPEDGPSVDTDRVLVDTAPPSMSAEELTDYLASLGEMQKGYLELLDAMAGLEDGDSVQREGFWSELETYQQEIRNYIEYLEERLPEGLSGEEPKPLTDEQKQRIAGKYHDSIKGDKNLLYAIAYDGRTLYSNSDLIAADGSMPAPEGYNFLLCFDGEKAHVFRDGREIDVYGDGYYREGNDWYLPGYANFQVDDTVKKATVCMAVAEAPVFYTEGSYGNGMEKQFDNSLYWMYVNLQNRRQGLLESLACLAAGLLLLLASFPLRKSRREAAEVIARFLGRIWLECKILLLLGLLYILFLLCLVFVIDGAGHDLWEEVVYAYSYDRNLEMVSWFGREMIGSIPPLFWIGLFWGLWLLWNDLRHNKKIWRCSLTAKLCRTFGAKGMDQPLSRKMSRRNRRVFLVGLLYAILMLAQVVLVNSMWTEQRT